ncbi:MAG: PH domain-containing protein [Acidimicrobiales bacterium]
MPLPRKLLTEGEIVIVELRPTWLVLGWPLVAVIGAAALAIVVVVTFPTAPSAVGYLMLAILLIAAGWLAVRALRWHTTSIVLTNRRILERRGVLSRTGVEIRLDRINELSYRQTLLERIVRTGSLVLEVGGETGVVLFNHLPQPAAVQSLVTEQIDMQRRGGWQVAGTQPGGQPGVASRGPYQAPTPMPPPPAPPPAGPTVADRLVQLDDLRQRGILSESEFQAKKLELLREL